MTQPATGFLCAALMLSASATAAAQQVDSLAAGLRVRVNGRCSAPGAPRTVVGGLIRPSPTRPREIEDTVWVANAQGTVAVPGVVVYSLDRSAGINPSEPGRSASAYFAVGAIAGVVLGVAANYEQAGKDDPLGPAANPVAGALLFGGLGALFGYVVGMDKRETWVAVAPEHCPPTSTR